MRTSKYLNKVYNGWTVIMMGIATVQGKKAKAPYHRGYYFLLERPTSDGLCDKHIRVSGTYMAKIARGEIDPEVLADKIADKNSAKATQRVGYHFKRK